MKQYVVVPFLTGCMSGNLDPDKLASTLNQHGQQSWRLVRTIHETKRVLGIFAREAHFLIFERDG